MDFIKKACLIINDLNPGEDFFYSVVCSIMYNKFKNRVNVNKKRFNTKKIIYTEYVKSLIIESSYFKMKHIKKFEYYNKINISIFKIINLNEWRCIYKSSFKHKKKAYIFKYKKQFIPIINIEKFLNISNNYNLKVCHICFKKIWKYKSINLKETYQKHTESCTFIQKPKLMMPSNRENIKFINLSNVVQKPFVIYIDFECYLQSISQNISNKTKLFQKHVPVSFAAKRICNANNTFTSNIFIYHGDNVFDELFMYLRKQTNIIDNINNTINFKINMSLIDKINFNNSKNCYVCKKMFNEKFIKMKDHNHLKQFNNYRGAICNPCNLNNTCLNINKIPIIMHGGSNYDWHLIFSNINKQLINKYELKINNILAKSSERFISFCINNYIFLDSFNFLSYSLAKLANDLNVKNFKYTHNFIKNKYPVFINDKSIYKKHIYPYSFLTDKKKYYTKEFPDYIYFKNNLKKENISRSDYAYAKNIYKK